MKVKFFSAVTATVAAALVVGCTPAGPVQSDAQSAGFGSLGSSETVDTDLTATINGLVIETPGTMTDYQRSYYPHWERISTDYGWSSSDVSEFGKCTSRDLILFQQGDKVGLDPTTCKITPGSWTDGFGKNGKTFTKSRDVDIDHVVALGEVWRSSPVRGLEYEERLSIANDPGNLIISDPSHNRSKGDQNAADYIPAGPAKCVYVEKYANTKAKYELSVTAPEKQRLLDTASSC